MAANRFQHWRRGEPTQALDGQDASRLTHWRRGEPLVAISIVAEALTPVTGTGDVTFLVPTLDGTGAVIFTGSGDVVIGAPSLDGTGTVTGGAVPTGRPPHGFRVERVPISRRIRASGGVMVGLPRLDGVGTVNDDELVLQLLEL